MTVERFLDLVARSDGSLMDIERLVPAAIDANEIGRHARVGDERPNMA